MCYFVKNVMKFLKELLCTLISVLKVLANTAYNGRKLAAQLECVSVGIFKDSFIQ